MGRRRSRSRSGGEAVVGAEHDEIAAPLAGLDIPLVAEKGVGMLDRNHAGSGILGERPLGGELAVIGIDAVDDVLPELIVKLKIRRPMGRFFHKVLHLVL